MNKSTRKLLDSSLSKALEPPSQRQQRLDEILKPYDDSSTQVPKHPSTPPQIEEVPSQNQPVTEKAAPEKHSGTQVPRDSSTSVVPQQKFYRKANLIADRVERQLTPAESKIFDQLVRLSIGFNQESCQVTVRSLMARTGYGSDKTVKIAIKGLMDKRCIRRESTNNSPDGDIYFILPYSGTQVPEHSSTQADSTQVLGAESTHHENTVSSKTIQSDDDEARMVMEILRKVERDITGGNSGEWAVVAEALADRARLIAARTKRITNLPRLLLADLGRDKSRSKPRSEGKGNRPKADPDFEEQIKVYARELFVSEAPDEEILEKLAILFQEAGQQASEARLRAVLESCRPTSS